MSDLHGDAIEIEEVCACGSWVRIHDAETSAVPVAKLWSEHHKGHGWIQMRKIDD